jgi:hypothetical protein
MNKYKKKKKKRKRPYIDTKLYGQLLNEKNISFNPDEYTILFINGQRDNPETKGGCMFLATLATLELLNTNNWSVSKLRQIAYDQVKENPFEDMDEEELQYFLDTITINGTWGGDEALSAIAKALNVNFYVMVYYKNNPPYIHEVLGAYDDNYSNGFLIWSGSHYDAFVRREVFSILLDGLHEVISNYE